MAGEMNFGLLNTNAPAQAGESVYAGQRNALAAQQTQQAIQENALKLQQYQQAADQQNKLQAYLAGTDINAPAGRAGLMQFGEAGMKLAKGQSDLATADATRQKLQNDLITQKLAQVKGLYGSVTTPEQYISIHNAIHDDPVLGPFLNSMGATKEQGTQQIQQAMQTPGGFEQLLRQSQLGIDKVLERTTMQQSLGGTQRVISMPKYGTGPATVVPGSEAQVTMTPYQQQQLKNEQARLSMERQRLSDSQATGVGELTPQTLDVLAQGYLQTGTLPPMGMGAKASSAKSAILNRAAELATQGGVAPDVAASNIRQGKMDTAAATNTLKDFNSGISSRRVTAVNTALNHLETMDKLVGDLGNSNIGVFNRAANTFAKETGNPAPTNLNAAKQIVAAEVIKAIVANGGGVTERQAAEQNFALANSPQQLKQVAETYRTLLGGQLDSLANQYETGTGRKDFSKRLSPATRGILDKVRTPATAAPTTTGSGATVSNW